MNTMNDWRNKGYADDYPHQPQAAPMTGQFTRVLCKAVAHACNEWHNRPSHCMRASRVGMDASRTVRILGGLTRMY